MIERSRKLTLFALAGVFTAPNFLDEFRLETARRCEREGWRVESHSLLPYGDWSRSKLRQSAEIAADVCGPLVGGRRAADGVARLGGDPASCGVVALLGHSGGGVAAAHAADELSRRGYRIGAVAMIGSPKTPIPKRIRELTAFFYIGNEEGRAADAIARVGRWFGRPPARLRSLALVGGHRDYFRSRFPFVGADGRSNLETTADAVAAWVNETAARAASRAAAHTAKEERGGG
jgi:hypothetical protein